MKKINWKYMKWSLALCLILPFLIPSTLQTDGKSHFAFGLPIKFITIYQDHPNSPWLFGNLFSGNSGMALNPSSFIINIGLMYVIFYFCEKILMKKEVANP